MLRSSGVYTSVLGGRALMLRSSGVYTSVLGGRVFTLPLLPSSFHSVVVVLRPHSPTHSD